MVHSRKQSHFCLAIHCTAKIQIPYSLLLLFFLRGKVGAGKEIFCASMIVIVVLNVKKKKRIQGIVPFHFQVTFTASIQLKPHGDMALPRLNLNPDATSDDRWFKNLTFWKKILRVSYYNLQNTLHMNQQWCTL